MIPDVPRQALLDALQRFDQELRSAPEWADWEQNRSHRYAIEHEGRRYPVRQSVKLATGAEFGSWEDANAFARDRGFAVRELREPEVAHTVDQIRPGLERILAEYTKARAFDPLGARHELWGTFSELADALSHAAPLRAHRQVAVTWSAGHGNWARVPRLALLDQRETDTANAGVFCGLWFRQDMSGVYLTLGQGWAEPRAQLGARAARELLAKRTRYLRALAAPLARAGFSLDDELDIRSEGGLRADLAAATVAYKLYPLGGVPEDRAIEADLAALLSAYEHYVTAGRRELPQAAGAAPAPAQTWRVEVPERLWDEGLRAGLLLAGHDEVGDLSLYADREALRGAFRTRLGPLYTGESAGDARAVELLWTLRSLRPGDRVVATRGADRVLGVGEVLEPGYAWQPARPEGRHTVRVRWLPDSGRTVAPRPEWERTPAAPAEAELAGAAGRGAPPSAELAAAGRAFAGALREAGVDYGARHDALCRSFLASLAAKRFAILTGLSGSGKTQLALRFGEWLGQGRALVVPVRPDWTGPEALLGYEDALAPAQAGARAWSVPEPLAFMLRAAAEPAHPFVLVLDEMNLAHVERYFADVLSGMESDYPVLPDLARGEGGRWYPRGEGRLPVPRNLFVVGTVNVDETTFTFSPKVLDRASTLEFRVAAADLREDAPRPARLTPAPELGQALLAAAADDRFQQERPASGAEAIAARLRRLHGLLAPAGHEFGHRVFYEALRFAALHEAFGDASADRALDLIVLQKVLPRLHGNRRRLEAPLLALGAFCLDPDAAAAPDPFGAPGPARLPLSFDKLTRMMRALLANQFASFTE